jgi:hypothetical protein
VQRETILKAAIKVELSLCHYLTMMNVTSTANNDWYKANYRYLMASALRVRQVLKNHLDSKQNQPTPNQWKESAALYEDADSTTVGHLPR